MGMAPVTNITDVDLRKSRDLLSDVDLRTALHQPAESEEALEALEETPVTAVFARRVRPGAENDYETWMQNVISEIQQFPGYQGVNVLRPHGAPGSPGGQQSEFVAILRFDSYANLNRWERSESRRIWLEQLEKLVLAEQPVQRAEGMEAWFTRPGAAAGAPPRYKMALALSVVVFALSISVIPVAASLLKSLPALLRQFLLCTLQVTLLTYLVLPQMTRLLAPWLYRGVKL